MVGQGVLRECVTDSAAEQVMLVARRPTGVSSRKMFELVHEDLFNWAGVETSLRTLTLASSASVYRLLADRSRVPEDHLRPDAGCSRDGGARRITETFVYVSGQGTNAPGRQMWARVKGATENALNAMPFAQVFCLRPGYIQPLHGIRFKVGWDNGIYAVLSWGYPLLRIAPAR